MRRQKLAEDGAISVTPPVTVNSMDSNALFSFLGEEGAHGAESIDKHIKRQLLQTAIPKKRKDISPVVVDLSADSDVHSSGESSPKKPRLCAKDPVVLDDFETEAKREVEASAGLTGTAESGARLELRHQVRYYFTFHFKYRCIV
jgi:ATP-dependent RNA helicase DOB1